jgi:hypothetical protein
MGMATAPKHWTIDMVRALPDDRDRYWIVDVDARVVERWRPDDERPEVLSDQLVWRPDVGRAALTINLVEYFAEVTGEALGPTA